MFALALLSSRPAVAAPFVLEFEGTISTLTITTHDSILNDPDDPGPMQAVVNDVAFTATMTFDGSRLAAASEGMWGSLPAHVYRDEDPANLPGVDPGIETSEWMRASMTLATSTPVTLDFDRDITNDIADATDFLRPYDGSQAMFYADGGGDGPPVGSDHFGFELSNRFTFVAADGNAVTSYLRAYDSRLSLAILTAAAFPPYVPSPELVDLFGPGVPTSFLWEDIDPSTLLDGRSTVPGTRFSHSTTLVAYDPSIDNMRRLTASYQGNLVVTRAELRSAEEPVDVPEPATALLTLAAMLTGMTVGRRRSRRPRADAAR